MTAQGSSIPTGNVILLVADDWKDYELLDSGEGRKLERYGDYRFDRPDAQALWPSTTPRDSWKPDAIFAAGGDKSEDDERGAWSFPSGSVPENWPVAWNGLVANARCASFRHLGLFPEHSVHWSWAAERIKRAARPVRVLNLFGYTGMMSLACAQAGAEGVGLLPEPVRHLGREPRRRSVRAKHLCRLVRTQLLSSQGLLALRLIEMLFLLAPGQTP